MFRVRIIELANVQNARQAQSSSEATFDREFFKFASLFATSRERNKRERERERERLELGLSRSSSSLGCLGTADRRSVSQSQQAALFTETLGHSKSECRASPQLRNCRLHRPRK
ncbi:hypothetical protein WN51_12555 [Melipona quadrifasciata]|uniref:Uncharacterized protein n=1 Tax=Melipona quadrifasciata TaxID=166423 RepID=A0A0M9A2C3_9HYME|nr:hypothetical protein WN51_12555 [Melipona quadrifasciata]